MFRRTAATYLPGSRTMPGERYTSPAIFAEEAERIFSREWNCLGRVSRIENPGDFIAADVASESILVVRDATERLNAFFNVCRHRGTRICTERSGSFAYNIQCPYHGWTYSTDGSLVAAPHMKDVEGFEMREHPLHRAAVAEWEGFVFVSLAKDPVPFDEAFAPMIGRLSRFGLPSLVVGHRVEYDVRANWKLVFQNYSECLHCPEIHPALSAILPFDSGANDLFEGPFLGGSMEIRPPNVSATMSGRACGVPLSAEVASEEPRRAFYYTLMPNLLLSLHPDYVNYYLIRPVAPDRTIVESEWLVPSGTLADPASNLRDAIEFWDVTNRQDWAIIERGQLGISSSRYAPGPYSPRESLPAAWDRHYLKSMGRA